MRRIPRIPHLCELPGEGSIREFDGRLFVVFDELDRSFDSLLYHAAGEASEHAVTLLDRKGIRLDADGYDELIRQVEEQVEVALTAIVVEVEGRREG